MGWNFVLFSLVVFKFVLGCTSLTPPINPAELETFVVQNLSQKEFLPFRW
jgi:hypothetical protein